MSLRQIQSFGNASERVALCLGWDRMQSGGIPLRRPCRRRFCGGGTPTFRGLCLCNQDRRRTDAATCSRRGTIERRYTGRNASDVNFSAGRYFGGAKQAASKLPFDAGFESVGAVAAVGSGVKLQPGQPVATLTYGGFSEYAVERAELVMPVPEASPRALVMLTSGLTASLALEMTGGIPLMTPCEGALRRGNQRQFWSPPRRVALVRSRYRSQSSRDIA